MARSFALLSVAHAVVDDSLHLLQMQAQRHDHHHVHHNQKVDVEAEGIRAVETPCNEIDGKQVQYLDRHAVNCGSAQALVSFGMTRQGCSGINQHYSYACQDANFTGSRVAYSPCQLGWAQSIQYLDRHDARCNPGEAIQAFHLGKNGCGGNDMKYAITCARYEGYDKSRVAYTPCNYFVGDDLAYLDRHGVVCGAGEYLEQFQMISGCPNGNDRRFMYNCGQTTTTTTTTTTTEPYNCRTRELWSAEKYAYCCTSKGVGCTTTTTTTTVATTTTVDDASAQDDPHLSDMAGDRFDLYDAGRQEFVVIPAGASAKDADLLVTGVVEKYGHRENDLWIRTLSVKGKWLDGGDYSFKTNSAAFGDAATIQVRSGKNHKWLPLEGLKDPKLIVSSKDKHAPTTDFAESVAKTVELKAGPLNVVVSYATAQKDGEKVNHLDLHVKNLHSVKSEVGGLLAGEVSA